MIHRLAVPASCILFSIVLAGCGSVISITEKATPADPASRGVDGIPFYAKKPQRTQETVWREIDVVVKILLETAPPTAPEKKEAVITVSRAIWTEHRGGEELRRLNGTTVTDSGVPERVAQIAAGLLAADAVARKQRTPGHLPPPGDLDLVSNRLLTQMVIDHSRVYYVNARHPLIGSGLLDVEIAEDQTLKKAKAEIHDDTFKEILAQLPLKEVLTGALGLASGTSGRGTWRISVGGAEELVRTWTARREHDTTPLPAPITGADVARGGVEIAVSVPSVPVKKMTFEGTAKVTP